MKDKVLFEVCCGCFEDAVQAEKGGADRIELNSALFLGGLTPSIGTVQAVKNTLLKIPVMCMVRPREGGFCYTDFDYDDLLPRYGGNVTCGRGRHRLRLFEAGRHG